MADRHPRFTRQPARSLASRVFLFASVSILASAGVVSAVAIHSIHAQLAESIEQSYPAALVRAADPLRALLASGQAALEALAADADLQRRRGSGLEGPLLRALGSSRYFAGLAVLAPDGNVRRAVGSAQGIAAEDLAALATAEVDAPTTLSAARRRAGPVIAVPLGGRSSLGSLVGAFRPSAFQALLVAAQPDGISSLYLIDEQGGVIVSAEPASEDGPDRLPAAALADAESSGVRRYTNARGRQVVGSTTPLGFLGWSLAIEAPFAKAFAPVLSVVTRIFACDLVLILIFGAVAYRLTTATVRPLELLAAGARRIAEGQFDLEIPEPDSRDEVGLLSRTFNDMVRQLRRKQNEIHTAQKKLRDRNTELEQANEVLSQLSITDGLTKVHNHRFFQDHLTREIKRAARVQEPLSMLLIDIDDFKRLNDRRGHAAGDELLAGMARTLVNTVRETDLLARYGGEEFVVVCSNTDRDGAYQLAEKIRGAIEVSSFIVDNGLRPTRVTVSIGAAQFTGDRRKFFEAADRALYRAKAAGKNCVVKDEDEIVI
jgi:diguanylate cyclase (GGDEF)-like protein